MMKKLRVGIIGLGVGEQHIEGYRRHPACEVVSLCDFSDEKLSMASKRYPDLALTRTATDILCNPKINIVSIASYDNYHYKQIVAGIEHGKHLFIEKPICLYEEELHHIQHLLNLNPEIKISSNLILRMSPRFRNLRRGIQAGELGKLFYVEGDYNYGRIHKIHSGWRGQLDYYSVVLGGAVHIVDLLLWLTGDRVTEVAAFGTNIASRGSSFKYDDMVVATVRFSSGMVGKVAANFGCVYPHFHNLTLYGTKATFINGLDHAALYTSRDPQVAPEIIRDPYPGTGKGDLIYSFVESIVGGTPAEVSADDIFNAMSVCFAIEKAAQTGSAVAVEYQRRESYGTYNTIWQADYRRRRKAGCA